MDLQPTFCRDCDNVHEQSRKQSARSWLCVRFPRLENMNPVDPTGWAKAEPYNRCVSINLGHCPCFVKRRDGQKEMGLKQEKIDAA